MMFIWSWLTQSKYLAPFPPNGAHLVTPDLALFTCGIDLFVVLGFFIALLYTFIHTT